MGRKCNQADSYSGGWRRSEVTTAIDGITMGFWFNVPDYNCTIRLYNGDDSTTGVGPQTTGDGTASVRVLHGGINWFGNTTPGYALSTWHSLIYTRSGGNGQLYLNGSAIGATWADAPTAPTGTGIFGLHVLYAAAGSGDMKAAEAFMYDRVLTTTEISAIGASRYSPLWYSKNLLCYSPGFGQDSPEPAASLGVFGGAVTSLALDTGGVLATKCDHPDILYPGIIGERGRVDRLRPRPFAPGADSFQGGL